MISPSGARTLFLENELNALFVRWPPLSLLESASAVRRFRTYVAAKRTHASRLSFDAEQCGRVDEERFD